LVNTDVFGQSAEVRVNEVLFRENICTIHIPPVRYWFVQVQVLVFYAFYF